MSVDREQAGTASNEWGSRSTAEPSKAPAKPLKIALVFLGCGCLSVIGLGLLATLLVPAMVSRLNKLNAARQAKIEADLNEIEKALVAYAANNDGFAPASLHMLAEPDPQNVVQLERVPVDPWSRAYAYERALEPHGKCRVLTYGADDRPGGEGPDGDVVREFTLR